MRCWTRRGHWGRRWRNTWRGGCVCDGFDRSEPRALASVKSRGARRFTLPHGRGSEHGGWPDVLFVADDAVRDAGGGSADRTALLLPQPLPDRALGGDALPAHHPRTDVAAAEVSGDAAADPACRTPDRAGTGAGPALFDRTRR